jgi:acyl carrier protein
MAQLDSNIVFDRTRTYVKENFLYTRPDVQLDEHEPLLEKGIIDSMGALELLEFLQSEFGISISDEEITADNFGSLGRITQLVIAKQQATVS